MKTSSQQGQAEADAAADAAREYAARRFAGGEDGQLPQG